MDYAMLWPIVLATLTAFLAVSWVYFKILRIALDKNLVDNPDARKLQKRPIPVLGGIAVFFGVLGGVLSGAVAYALVGDPSSTRLLPVLCAMSVMLYVGAMDDILGLTPRSRLVIEVLTMVGLIYSTGACVDTFRGLWGVGVYSWWIAVPLTVFAGVGIINAVNMIDGVNGLSSGLCITCCGLFGAVFIKIGDTPNTVLAFATAAALLPFFIHNVFGLRSRMFIGDAGTMVMGVMLTWFVISVLGSHSPVSYFTKATGLNAIALTLAILSVPVFDTLRVMTLRVMNGRSPFSPDKTHLHHVFVNVGVSHFITAMSEILIGIVVVLLWVLGVLLGASTEGQLYIVVASSMALVWGTYALLRYHAKHHTAFLHWLTAFSVRTHLGRTDWWKRITGWLDAPCSQELEEERQAEEALRERLSLRFQHVDMNNHKERDRKRVLDYMKDRAEVLVTDLMAYSGAEPLRIYPILFEEIQSGYVLVLKESGMGSPEIVALSRSYINNK